MYSSSFFFLLHKISRVFISKQPRLLSIQPTTFPPIQNNSKSESVNFFQHFQWSSRFRTYLNHLISKTLFQNIFPNNNLKAPFQGELTKYLSTSLDTKKNHLSLSYSAFTARLTARLFSVDTDHDKSETISMSPIIGINNFHKKKTGLILPAPKISILPTSQSLVWLLLVPKMDPTLGRLQQKHFQSTSSKYESLPKKS